MGKSVRAAPSSPVPARPSSQGLPPCVSGLLTPRRPEGPASGSPGFGVRVPGQHGGGALGGGERRRQGGACGPRVRAGS